MDDIKVKVGRLNEIHQIVDLLKTHESSMGPILNGREITVNKGIHIQNEDWPDLVCFIDGLVRKKNQSVLEKMEIEAQEIKAFLKENL